MVIGTAESRGAKYLAIAVQTERNSLLEEDAKLRSIDIRSRLMAVLQRSSYSSESDVWAHGTAVQVLEPDNDLSNQYLDRLEKAQSIPELWAMVHDDPVALTSDRLMSGKEPELLKFYLDNRNWIHDYLETIPHRSP